MKVLKFGGTSVGSAERIADVANLISNGEKNIVVLSAMSGTTNALVEITDYLYKGNSAGAAAKIVELEAKYYDVVEALFKTDEFRNLATVLVKERFDVIRSFVLNKFTDVGERAILAQGELISTNFMVFHLKETGRNAALLPALDFMKIDENDEPVIDFIRENISPLLQEHADVDLFITQGFICKNPNGEIDNLKRGGSDYTATLIGAAILADEIQIWTDIDGMHNNDPRIVENTKPIAEISFDEAAELAYFGAKILHPTSVLPARLSQVPVRLLNTMDPSAHGTLISNSTEKNKVKAIAAKDGITAIKIKSGRMLLAYGFLRKVFEIFEKYKTPIDMITTSEVGVSLTIDNDKFINEIVSELKEYGTVSMDTDQVIVCIAGDFRVENSGVISQITSAVENIPVRMISYGGSSFNISLLINAEDKKETLQTLSNALFD